MEEMNQPSLTGSSNQPTPLLGAGSPQLDPNPTNQEPTEPTEPTEPEPLDQLDQELAQMLAGEEPEPVEPMVLMPPSRRRTELILMMKAGGATTNEIAAVTGLGPRRVLKELQKVKEAHPEIAEGLDIRWKTTLAKKALTATERGLDYEEEPIASGKLGVAVMQGLGMLNVPRLDDPTPPLNGSGGITINALFAGKSDAELKILAEGDGGNDNPTP